MKKGLCLVLAVLMAVGLAACASPQTNNVEPAQEPATGEQQNLLVWWWGEGDTPGSKAWLEETAAKYETLNPGIHIELVEQTSDQLYPAWEAAIQAGTGPDIQFLWTGVWALDYIWKDALADITELIPEEERSHWVATEGLSYNDKPWLSPWYQISIVWMYNKELFAAAGLDPNSPPSNYEELLTACEALKNSGVIPLELGGMKDGWGAAWLYSVFGPAAHDSFKEYIEAGAKEGEFASAKHTEWLQILHELQEKGYTNPLTMSYDFFQGRESFLRGESAMGLATNGQAIQWIEEMGGEEKVGIMNIPVMGNGALAGKLNNQAHSFAIPKFSKHQQEAADFLVFTHQPEQLESWYQLTKNIPCDDRFDPAWLTTDSEREIYEQLANNGIPYAEIYIPAMVDSEGMYAAVQMVFSGSTAQEAAEYMESVAAKWRAMDPEGVNNFNKWAEDYQ